MSSIAVPERPRILPRLWAWKRVRFTLILSAAIGLFLGVTVWTSTLASIVTRAVILGLVLMLVFGLFERWPRRLPRRIARWPLQVIAVALVIPPTTAIIWWLSTPAGEPAFYLVPTRMQGYSALTGFALLAAPWIALGALVRQREALAREQALAFDLERSELERQALDARLRLLQAQVAPHFLFNTLANVQALVDAGSPQASDVLRSLVGYLRAAVPRLNERTTTLGQELDLVRAYLELMHMRMPDRLTFALEADVAARALVCPPMTLLTLVENAVRHGIDPSEVGGAIEIRVERRGDRCVVRVSDSGIGLGVGSEPGGAPSEAPRGDGLGSGLATLRERLVLVFGGDASVRVVAREGGGVTAELEFPAREAMPV